MKQVEWLTQILTQIAELYDQMAEKTREEKSVLESASMERLNEILIIKEAMAARIRELEDKRASIMEKIAKKLDRSPGDITLQELASMPENSLYRENLMALRERLRKTGEAAAKVNDFNRALLGKAISTVRESIEYAAGLIEPAVTYSAELSVKNRTPSGQVVKKSY